MIFSHGVWGLLGWLKDSMLYEIKFLVMLILVSIWCCLPACSFVEQKQSFYCCALLSAMKSHCVNALHVRVNNLLSSPCLLNNIIIYNTFVLYVSELTGEVLSDNFKFYAVNYVCKIIFAILMCF